MNHFKQKLHHSPGQALVEFALVIVAVLMMIFLIIESARILWAWNTVQNAARIGARYAITGSWEGPECVVDFGAEKFLQSGPDGRYVCNDLRLASVIAEAHQALTGLPLNETSTTYEDDHFYNIEVWGVDEYGELQYDFAGVPKNHVIVRATYRVPIITPFFSPILASLPVFGQETLLNESFGQLSSTGGVALPPDQPPIPTPGPTPTPAPPTDTPTASPTPTDEPPAPCAVKFATFVLDTHTHVWITGAVGSTVEVRDLTEGGQLLASGVLEEGGTFVCPGFAGFPVNPDELIFGHVLMVENLTDTTLDTITVLGTPPTDTPSPTSTLIPTATPSPTFTPLPSVTPVTKYITLQPNCGWPAANPGNVTFTVFYVNWPINRSITLQWNGTQIDFFGANQHSGTFSKTYTRSLPQTVATYTVTAVGGANSGSFTTQYFTPCGNETPVPSPTPSNTPSPPDLLVFGPVEMISTPPIVAYQPVQFRLPVTNTGDVNINTQFFVDIYLDPDPSSVLSTTIPIEESDGYSAISFLGGGESRVVTITAYLGFPNPLMTPTPQAVYGFADSLEQIVETDETNNITDAEWVLVTPAATPTPSPTPGGSDTIAGAAYTFEDDLIPRFRTFMQLIDESDGRTIATTLTDQSGYFAFSGVPGGTTYTVTGCITIDGETWFGFRNGIMPPNPMVILVMFKGPCP
ncbi:MAG TPA: TadE/TadG family type IV pilus assembly protein [Chloroflexota bacterium]|nr:TadE/TadG family type IV pilus assembly protein [Chloroflexota bacterium]